MTFSQLARSLTASLSLLSGGLALADNAQDPVLCTRGSSDAVNACLAAPRQPIVFPGARVESQSLRWREVHGALAPAPATLDGETAIAPEARGIWRLEAEQSGAWRAVGPDVITRVFFAGGGQTELNGYRIGKHPGEGRAGKYAPPRYFIEVTKESAAYPISQSLKLGQFLTKDQHAVWPKYVPLEPALVDKLERVAQALRAEGRSVKRLHVMSGYRTPRYNGPGGKGRAKFSRHTYGDAADVWVDDDGDGVMDDLNGDGKVNHADAEYLATVSRRVEEKSPELAGGAGTYKANSSHGPFTHIDVRGHAASWAKK